MPVVNELESFRAAALLKDMTDEAIDRWLGLARPILRLGQDGSGPVVGHFGGLPALPASVAWPDDTVHLASLDLASLPREAIDLALPDDGTLIFFTQTYSVPTVGQVIHVPAGTPVTEAPPPDGTQSVYDRVTLRVTPDWSLPESPSNSLAYRSEHHDDEDVYRSVVWSLGDDGRTEDDVAVLGGFGVSNSGGLGVPVKSETEVLLAEFFLTEDMVGDDFETDYATLFYVITRDDLAAHRFDRVSLASDFHG